MKKPTLALLVVAAAMLAACEPSQSEIEKAMKDSIGSTNSAIAGLLGNGVRIEIRDVRKLGCEKSSAASYKCDVEWTATLPVLGDSKKLGTLTFMKASDGWAVSE
jgi:hypothetical protein